MLASEGRGVALGPLSAKTVVPNASAFTANAIVRGGERGELLRSLQAAQCEQRACHAHTRFPSYAALTAFAIRVTPVLASAQLVGYTRAMAATSQMLPLGTPMPAFALADAVSGRSVSSSELAGKPAVVAFICNHCPYVQHLRSELARFGRDSRDRGVALVGISS